MSSAGPGAEMTTKQWLMDLVNEYAKQLDMVETRLLPWQYAQEFVYVQAARRLVEQWPEEPAP